MDCAVQLGSAFAAIPLAVHVDADRRRWLVHCPSPIAARTLLPSGDGAVRSRLLRNLTPHPWPRAGVGLFFVFSGQLDPADDGGVGQAQSRAARILPIPAATGAISLHHASAGQKISRATSNLAEVG
jgi:hypothetical protein